MVTGTENILNSLINTTVVFSDVLVYLALHFFFPITCLLNLYTN